MPLAGYAILVFLYFLIFWGTPLAVTKGKSKSHQVAVVIILHVFIGLCASLIPQVMK